MRTRELTMTALCCALTCILAPMTVTLPITLIPFSLSLLPIFLTGALLPKKNAFLAILLYVILGLVGLPVFSGFAAGVGVLAGPTGGFIVGAGRRLDDGEARVRPAVCRGRGDRTCPVLSARLRLVCRFRPRVLRPVAARGRRAVCGMGRSQGGACGLRGSGGSGRTAQGKARGGISVCGAAAVDLWSDPRFNASAQGRYALYMADPIHPTKAGYWEWWTPYMETRLCERIE